MKSYWRLLRFLKPHVGVFALAVGCMAACALFEGVSLGLFLSADRVFVNQRVPVPPHLPAWLQGLLQRLNDLDPSTLLLGIVIAIPALFFAKGLTVFFKQYLMNDVSQRVIRDLRQTLFNKMTGLSASFFDRESSGQLLSRITYDVGVLQNSITEGLAELIYQLLRILVFASIVLTLNWQLAVVAAVLLPLITLPIVRIGAMLRKLSRRTQQMMGEMTNTLYETFTGIPVIQAYGVERQAREKFAAQSQRVYRLALKSNKRMTMLSPLTELIGALGAAFALWYIGREVLNQQLSLGMLVVCMGALLSLIHPFKRLSNVHSVNAQASAAADRIFEMVDLVPTIQDRPHARVLPPFQREIRYERVSFEYNAASPVLQDIDLTIRAGEVVAFVGLSGVGKTTLVNLLPRFYDVTTGRITVDGIDLRDATIASLRRQIALVPQETTLFNDTVRNNIALGWPSASVEDVVRAAQAANAHDFICGLPQGYDTVIGEAGGLLSGGQRQRLALSRAFVRNAPIVILDEATSQLDAESEQLVSTAIANLLRDRTVLLIAHRLSTVRHAHRIVMMHEGRIVDDGTHDELLTRNPLYRRLTELQFATPSHHPRRLIA